MGRNPPCSLSKFVFTNEAVNPADRGFAKVSKNIFVIIPFLAVKIHCNLSLIFIVNDIKMGQAIPCFLKSKAIREINKDRRIICRERIIFIIRKELLMVQSHKILWIIHDAYDIRGIIVFKGRFCISLF